jgi:Protein of unknown function (DUF1360)
MSMPRQPKGIAGRQLGAAMSRDTPRALERIVGYLALLSLYGAGLLTAAAMARTRGRPLAPAYHVRDLLIGAVATHKVTRLIDKDVVTTPIRAPFTGSKRVQGRERSTSPRFTATCPTRRENC